MSNITPTNSIIFSNGEIISITFGLCGIFLTIYTIISSSRRFDEFIDKFYQSHIDKTRESSLKIIQYKKKWFNSKEFKYVFNNFDVQKSFFIIYNLDISEYISLIYNEDNININLELDKEDYVFTYFNNFKFNNSKIYNEDDFISTLNSSYPKFLSHTKEYVIFKHKLDKWYNNHINIYHKNVANQTNVESINKSVSINIMDENDLNTNPHINSTSIFQNQLYIYLYDDYIGITNVKFSNLNIPTPK